MNLISRLFFAIVLTTVAVTALLSQRWALGREPTDKGPLVTFQVSERLTRPTILRPPVVLRPPIGPIDLPKHDALQRASNESGVRIVEPTYLVGGFTLRKVTVVNRWPNVSYVELVFSDGADGFVLRHETAPGKLGTLFEGTSVIKALEVPNHPDMFGVSDEGRRIAYYRRTSHRGYDLFMGPPAHPLTREEALRLLISLPSR